MNKDKLSIGEAADFLNVSIDTLRRWDSSGKLKAVRSDGGHRYYYREQLVKFTSDLKSIAKNWSQSKVPPDIQEDYYCKTQDVFRARLDTMAILIDKNINTKELASLITAVVGEIGNNSFDHNFGNWSDVPGIFFAYDTDKRIIVLADRGQGILKTLLRVKPDLENDKMALKVAFTEHISGRAPEKRGNGLKFVRNVTVDNAIGVYLQSGTAFAEIEKNNGKLDIKLANHNVPGTLSIINY